MSDIRRFGCYVAYDSDMRSLVGTREFPGGPYVYYDEHSALMSEALAMAKAKDATIADLTRKLAEAEKYAAPENAKALSSVKNPCTKHNQYWTTHFGCCMACRAVDAEAKLAAAEKALADEREAGRWARENIRRYWDFTEEQQHRHTWHCREDFIAEWDKRLAHVEAPAQGENA